MGNKIKRYKFLEEIGRGGMGIVYKAIDTTLNRIVAIKVLEVGGSIKKEDLKRFKREASIIASFKHPNVVTIHDIVDDNGKIFFVMDLIEGDTLEKIISVKKKFSEKESLSLILKIAKALQAFHAKGIVHRDIKPSNIMITPNKDMKILDFGTAKIEGDTTLTRTGAFVGTLAFAAPEQLNQAKNVDIRSDIYSLGATFYYLLTGEQPYKGGAMEIMYQHCFAQPPAIDGANPLVTKLLSKMMAKKQDDRYKNPSELLHDIVSYRGDAKAELPLWGEYLVTTGAIKNEDLAKLLFSHKKMEVPILDMASEKWFSYKISEQVKISKLYQQCYAKAIGLEIEKTFYSGGASFAMRLIPPGRFIIGSKTLKASADEQPAHPVIITHAFWLAKYPITQRQWKSVTGETPWRGQNDTLSGGNFPATFITWNDITTMFLPKLDEEYIMPTEAQWEYSCRSGITSLYYWGNNSSKAPKYAWYAENAHQNRERYPHIVGQKKANHWGLCDMLGNIWEKCSDYYDKYTKNEKVNPKGPAKGLQRVDRGGAWDTYISQCRMAKRSCSKSNHRNSSTGFRLAKKI